MSAVGLGYLAHILLARLMGVTEYGVYVYALGWAVPLAALGGMGVHMVALRFVPTYVSRDEYGLIRGAYRLGANIAFVAGVSVTLLALLVLATFRNNVSSSIWWAMVVGLALAPLLSLTHFNASYLRALKRVGLAGLSDVVRPPLLVAGGGVLSMVTGALIARDLLMVLGGILVAVAGIQFLLVRRAQPALARQAVAKTDFPSWKQAVGAMLLIEIFQAFMIKADILLLGAMMDMDAVAVFGVAARVAGLVGFVVAAVNTIAAPMFTELHGKGSRDALDRLVGIAARWMLWPSVSIAIVLAISSSFVLGLFGQEFVAGKYVMWILLAAQLVHAGTGPVFVLVTFTGFHDHSARIYGYMLVLNLVLNLVAIHLFGILGAGLAALVTTITWNVLLHRAVSSKLGLVASPLARILVGDH